MAYKLDYGSVIQLPTENPYGLMVQELKHFNEEDFTLIMRVKSSAKDILSKKGKDENPESCIFGRAGMHMGVFYIPSINSYKFAYWDLQKNSDTYDYQDIHGVTLEDEYFVTIALSHSKKEKTFNLYIDGRKVGEKKYNSLIDYSETFINIGVANIQENAHPHQCFWSGEFEFLEIYKNTFNDVLLSKTTNLQDLKSINSLTKDFNKIVSYDFDEENITYYSILDVSNNGNRGRINQQKINDEYHLV